MDAQTGKDIVQSIAQEQRPPEQIGGDIDYSQVTRGVRMLLTGVVALVAVLIGLSMVIPVEEVARARGEFVPLQRVQVIQAPEGGALAAVLVHNDEKVTKGQSIAKFRAEDLLRDLARSEVRMAYLAVQVERLDAFAADRPPVFDPYRDQYPAMVKEAVALDNQQRNELARNLEEKDKQIDEEKSALDAAQRLAIEKDLRLPVDALEIQPGTLSGDERRRGELVAIPEIGVEEGVGDHGLVVAEIGIGDGTCIVVAGEDGAGDGGHQPVSVGVTGLREDGAGGLDL